MSSMSGAGSPGVDAVLAQLAVVPARADTEDQPAARDVVEAGDGLSRDDRLALGGEQDGRAEGQPFGGTGDHAEGDQWVGDPRMDVCLLLARRRREVRDGQVGVLAEEQRLEPALLQRPAQPHRVDVVVEEAVPEPDLHLCPLIALRSFGTRSARVRSAPRWVGL
jgi:hypothetical protein